MTQHFDTMSREELIEALRQKDTTSQPSAKDQQLSEIMTRPAGPISPSEAELLRSAISDVLKQGW
jgi:hypothetical protein